jgi:hypothetical protein
MIYKLEVEDDSYIEVCVYDRGKKEILLHVAEIRFDKNNKKLENFINFELDEISCKKLIKCLRHAIEDIY